MSKSCMYKKYTIITFFIEKHIFQQIFDNIFTLKQLLSILSKIITWKLFNDKFSKLLYITKYEFFFITPSCPTFVVGNLMLSEFVYLKFSGWGQSITMFPYKYSIDPDFPEERDFNYTWFCRVVAPEYEDWHELDDEEFPVYDPLKARGVPRPKDAIVLPWVWLGGLAL